jgi:hypothetical protein
MYLICIVFYFQLTVFFIQQNQLPERKRSIYTTTLAGNKFEVQSDIRLKGMRKTMKRLIQDIHCSD